MDRTELSVGGGRVELQDAAVVWTTVELITRTDFGGTVFGLWFSVAPVNDDRTALGSYIILLVTGGVNMYVYIPTELSGIVNCRSSRGSGSSS